MSDLQTSIRTYLKDISAVTDLVSASRIRPDKLEQNEAMPAVVVNEFDSSHAHSLAGAAGIYESRVRLDCYASTRLGSTGLANVIREQMEGYRGIMGTDFVHSCMLDTRVKDTVHPKDGSDSWHYRTRLLWRMRVTETIPTFGV